MARDPEYNDPAPKKSNTLWYVLGGVGAVILLGCLGCVGCMGFGWYQTKNLDKLVENDPGTPVTAVALSTAFKDNPANANTQFQGKTVLLTGTVSKVTSPMEIELAGTPGGDPVRCQASISNTTLFQNVAPGQTVTVKGYCTGKLMGSLQVSTCLSVTKQ